MIVQTIGTSENFAELNDTEKDRKFRALLKQINFQKEINEKLRMLTSASKPLSVFQFKQICTDKSYINQQTFHDFQHPSFDEVSLFFVKVLTTPNEYKEYIGRLPKIFNEYFTGPQLNRHLNNLLKYLVAINFNDKKRKEVINLQLSLLSTHALMEAAKYCEGLDVTNFNTQFLLSLETASLFEDLIDENLEVKFMHAFEKMREKWSEVMDVFLGDIKNLIVADELLSSETPTSIYEAQGTVMTVATKYQTAAFMAFAASTVIGPAGLTLLALPAITSVARKAYLRWMRSAPLALPPLTDYSKKDKYSYSNTFIGREEIIEKILQIWNQKKHPILVGPPGVGKTAIIMEIGRRIAMKQLPGFEDKTLFAGSAAAITGENMMGPPAFQRILKTLQPYKEGVILALDEAHALALGKSSLTLLRSATDNSRESLRYCLFATTPDGYESAFEKDESLRRRIVKIDIPSMEKAELLYLVNREAKLISPLLTIEEKALEILYKQTNGDQNETRQLVHRILGLAESKNSGYPIIQERDSKNAEVKLFLSYYRDHHNTLKDEVVYAEKIKKLREELAELEKECEQEKKIRQAHIMLLEQLSINKEKRLLYSKAMWKVLTEFAGKDVSEKNKIQCLNDQNFLIKHEKMIKDLLILQFFEIPYQVEYLKKFEKNLDLVSVIDEQNVENITKEANSKLCLELPQTPNVETESKGPFGLKNLGNSCYLNATLQMLFNIPDVLQIITNGTSNIAKSIYDVYQAKNNIASQQKALNELRNHIFDKRNMNTLNGSKLDQHDAQELLQLILNELNWRPIKMHSILEIANDNSNDNLTTSLENVLSIALYNQVETFEELIWKYFEKVQMIADGKKVLALRGKHQSWSQTLQIKEMTPYIIVHLKRFDEDFNKIVLPVKFPGNNIIKVPINREKCEYEIFASINHLGSSLEKGHYTANIKIFDEDQKDEQWFDCNDQEIKKIDRPENLAENAYVVLLKKK